MYFSFSAYVGCASAATWTARGSLGRSIFPHHTRPQGPGRVAGFTTVHQSRRLVTTEVPEVDFGQGRATIPEQLDKAAATY